MNEMQIEVITESKLPRVPRTIIIIGVFIALLLIASLLNWQQHTARPEAEIYFTADISEDMKGWTALDARWVEEEQGVRLSRREFVAPYLMYHLSPEESPPEDFVWHLPLKVSSFTDGALVLGAVFLPHGPLAVVMDREGRLGFAHDLFAPPDYSILASMPTEQWVNLYVHFNDTEDQVELYMDGRQVHTASMLEPTFPVSEVWLGALWIKGAGNYGTPIDVTYKSITFGNESLINTLSYWEYCWNLALDLLGR